MQPLTNNFYTRLLLLRHAQTNHNTQGLISGRSDVPINERGHEQAKLLANRIKEQYAVDILYCSPLQRARQTAQYLSQALNLPIIINNDLTEYGFGELSDADRNDLEESNPALFKQIQEWEEAPADQRPQRPQNPGMEPIDEFKHRIQAFTNKFLKDHSGKIVAAVSHGGFIKSFFYYHVGGDFSRYVPFWVDNTSVSIIDFYKGNPVIRLFNDISHIKEELELGAPRIL